MQISFGASNPIHRCFTWGLRSMERHVVDFYIFDFQTGLRALVKTGYGVRVTPYVEKYVFIDIDQSNKDMSPQFVRWLADRNLSSDDRFMEDETLEQIRKRCKWENDDYICRGHILNENASSKKFLVSNFNNYKMVDSRQTSTSWKDFIHSLKHKDELLLVQLGSQFRIEETLRVEESGKGNSKEIAGSSLVNMIEDGKNKNNNKNNKAKKRKNDDTLVRLPMDIRLKIDFGKSVGDLTSYLPQSLFDVGSGRISIVAVDTLSITLMFWQYHKDNS
ncbi:uncharacterized membrane protein-like protein [Tanacetum coccineum]|uniref:Uncharacterized membrane protein-like protein n=1 Tax=Tanacetum coccineum TaxID=301880 RepID=A0ABQ4Y0H4_9ASTR